MSSHFDIVDFRLFANIASAASFTAGAERSNLSTSAASLRIRHLEESLGGQLFHRTRQGVTLTPAGEACLRRVETILREFESIKGDIRRYAQPDRERLTIAVSNAGANDPLPAVLREFKHAFADLNIGLEVKLSNEIAQAVADGLADIGIGATGPFAGLEVRPYLSDRLQLIVPPEHPLATSGPVRFADALAYDLIGLPEGSQTQAFMRRIAQNSRQPLRVSMTVSSVGALCRMVEAGLGIGVVSRRSTLARNYGGRLVTVELKDRAARTDIGICAVSFRELHGRGERLVEMLQQSAGEPDQR